MAVTTFVLCRLRLMKTRLSLCNEPMSNFFLPSCGEKRACPTWKLLTRKSFFFQILFGKSAIKNPWRRDFYYSHPKREKQFCLWCCRYQKYSNNATPTSCWIAHLFVHKMYWFSESIYQTVWPSMLEAIWLASFNRVLVSKVTKLRLEAEQAKWQLFRSILISDFE